MRTITFLFLLAFVAVSTSMISNNPGLTAFHADGLDGWMSSSNPPLARTGAPGEANCTACHSGTTSSAAGTVTCSFSDVNEEYIPGQTYTIDLSIASGAKNGFQMTILDANDDMAGSFTAGTNSGTSTSGGRNYIYHTGSTGVTSWSFDWTAPSTDMGNLTVYYSFNKSNANGGTSGDEIYLGQETISISSQASLTDYQQLQKNYQVFVDQQQNNLIVNYRPLKGSKVVLQLLDLSGKLVYQEDLGQKNALKHQEKLNLSMVEQSGIYIVSLLIDNYVLNQKIWIQ